MSDKPNDTKIYVAHEDAVPFDFAAPEKNLLRAVLTAAMDDLRKSGDTAKKAVEYFLSSEEQYIFSFRGICFQLGMDPDQVLILTGIKERCLELIETPATKNGNASYTEGPQPPSK